MTNESEAAAQGDLDDRPVILVVDDEWPVRMVLVEALRDAGQRVVEAASAVEAVALIQSGAQVDLVFTDVRMPGAIDGLGLLAFVRSEIPQVPVIVSSGDLPGAQAMLHGAAAFVSKPYRLDQVTALIDSTLGESG